VPEQRPAITLALDGIPLRDHPEILREAVELGYRDIWTAEIVGVDGFTPLAVAAMVAPEMRLGIAIANVFSRGPATLAMHAAAIEELAPGRFTLGIGMGSPATVERWNGVPYRNLKKRVEEYLAILRSALAGERVEFAGETISINGLRMERPPEGQIPIYVAALRGKMLHFAGEKGDGVITNWLGADDVPQVVRAACAGAMTAGKDPKQLEVVCRVPVILDAPSEETDTGLRRSFCSYMNVPAYANFQSWLGHGEPLQPMWEAWSSGDRKAAVAAVPEDRMHEIFVQGSPEKRREHIQRFYDGGVDVAIYHFSTHELDPARRKEIILQGIRDMAPH
jgi:probable F420-dependent oxidoreductase